MPGNQPSPDRPPTHVAESRPQEALPFWRKRELDDVLRKVRTDAVLLQGGRGMGKTVFLAKVREDLEDEQQEIVSIDGRQTPAARSTIVQMRTPPRVLLIDDLDAIYTLGRDDDTAVVQSTGAALWNLRRQSQSSGTRFVVTASVEGPSPLLERIVEASAKPAALTKVAIDAYSRLTQSLAVIHLNPWGHRWKKDWDSFFDEEFSSRLGAKSLCELWNAVTIEVTGGHPALAGPVTEQLHALCDARDSRKDLTPFDLSLVKPPSARLGQAESERLTADVRRYIEDHCVEQPLRRIASAVRRLQDSSNPLEKQSFNTLVELARHNPSGAKTLEPASARQILRAEGLVYQDDETGQFITPGSILRTHVLDRATVRSGGARTVDLAQRDADSGTLIVRIGSEERRIEFAGTPWKILQALHSQPGETLSVETLRKLGDLENERAVKNALQRLQQKLRVHELGHVIVNEYRKGYRLMPAA